MKKFRIVITILGFSMLLNGCSALNNQESTSSNITQEVKVSEGTQTEIQKGEKVQQTTEGNATEKKREPADLAGEISQIIGNEITLKIVKMPEMAEMPQQSQIQQDDTEEQKKSTPKAITGSTDNGAGGPGGGGFPGGPRGETSTRSNSQRNKSTIDLDYTGEEKTITIPVGMGITSRRTEVTFETLQEGDVVSIWLNDNGTVEKASLIGGGTQ